MQLIFIYNAKGGFLNGAMDYAHKLLSPATYQCELCSLTYNNLGMKKQWKDFLENLEEEITFLHKDELLNTDFKGIALKLPCVLLKNDKNITPLLSAEDFKKIDSLPLLIESLKNKLKTFH